MTGPQTTDSLQLKLFYELARAFQTGDVALIAKHVHKDHRRTIYPRSLGRPELTGEQWLQNISEQMSLWTGDTEASYTTFCPIPDGMAKSLVADHPLGN